MEKGFKQKLCGVFIHKDVNMNERGYVGTNFLNLLRFFDIKAAKEPHMSYGNDVWRDYFICKRCKCIYVGNYTIS